MGNSSCVIHADFPRKAEPLSVNVPCRPLPPRYLAFPEGLCRFLVCVRLFVSRLISPGDRGSQLSHSDLRVSPQLCHRSAVGCWASAFTSWNFGFLFCRNGDNKTSSTEWS